MSKGANKYKHRLKSEAEAADTSPEILFVRLNRLQVSICRWTEKRPWGRCGRDNRGTARAFKSPCGQRTLSAARSVGDPPWVELTPQRSPPALAIFSCSCLRGGAGSAVAWGWGGWPAPSWTPSHRDLGQSLQQGPH